MDRFLLAGVAAVAAPQVAVSALAEEYFDVMTVECSERSGDTSFEARVDMPVGGGDAVMASVRKWMEEVLDTEVSLDVPPSGFEGALRKVGGEWIRNDGAGQHRVEITWLYEDPTCVSYDAVITDRDSVVWTTSFVASFSKRDGHRVTVKEVFGCDERQIKRLMWKYRGDLPMEVSSPDGLYVGDVAFVDGWVIVTGPARGTSGAEYRLRYPEIEQWLVPAHGEGYLAY